EGAALSLSIENGTVVEVGGGGSYELPEFSGNIGGNYDLGKSEFSGEATATLKEQVQTNSPNVKVTAVDGTAVLEANKVSKITSGVEAEITVSGLDPFQVRATDGEFTYEGGVLGGSSADRLGDLAQKLEEAVTLVNGGNIPGPWTPDMMSAYLSYRAFVVGDLDIGTLRQVFTEIFAILDGGFEYDAGAFPQWLTALRDWITAGAQNTLKEHKDWIATNLRQLGDEMIAFLSDDDDWGHPTLRQAGEWAVQAAGISMDTTSQAGESVGDDMAGGVDALAGTM
ncbi:MAG: hypothetical protein KC561_02060, partial [Myxococcales bacterium]|nr:hypothetical protein [Myxococcales bacterium]